VDNNYTQFFHLYIYLQLHKPLAQQNHSLSKAFEVHKLASYRIIFHNFFSEVSTHTTMGFRLPGMRKTSFGTNQTSSKGLDVAKGYLAVYVGERLKRFVIPVSFLNQPSFQDLLSQVVEEFGYDHPMGGLTIPCGEDVFLDITSRLMRC